MAEKIVVVSLEEIKEIVDEMENEKIEGEVMTAYQVEFVNGSVLRVIRNNAESMEWNEKLKIKKVVE